MCHHHSVVQTRFTALKMSCLSPVHSSRLPPDPLLVNTDLFYCVYRLAFLEWHVIFNFLFASVHFPVLPKWTGIVSAPSH